MLLSGGHLSVHSFPAVSVLSFFFFTVLSHVSDDSESCFTCTLHLVGMSFLNSLLIPSSSFSLSPCNSSGFSP